MYWRRSVTRLFVCRYILGNSGQRSFPLKVWSSRKLAVSWLLKNGLSALVQILQDFFFFFLSVLFVCRFTTQLVNLLANLSILWQQARFQIHLDAQIHKTSVKCLTWQPNPHTLLLLVGERQQQAGMPAYLWVFAGPNTRSCPQI